MKQVFEFIGLVIFAGLIVMAIMALAPLLAVGWIFFIPMAAVLGLLGLGFGINVITKKKK